MFHGQSRPDIKDCAKAQNGAAPPRDEVLAGFIDVDVFVRIGVTWTVLRVQVASSLVLKPSQVIGVCKFDYL